MEVSKSIGADRRTVTDYGDADTSTAVAMEIAAQLGKRVDETRPLAESIDPDALDRLFRADDTDIEVTFSHESFRVSVTSSGVEVTRVEPEF